MEDLTAFGYFLVFVALVGLALRAFLGGLKEGVKPSIGIASSKADDSTESEDGFKRNREQLSSLFSKRKQFVKNAAIGMFFTGAWLICGGTLHDSLDARQAMAYWICKGVEECTIRTADSMKPILEWSLWLSASAFVVVCLFALRKWIKLVILTGKIRDGKAEIALDPHPVPKPSRFSWIVALPVAGLLSIGFVLLHFLGNAAAPGAASARRESQPPGSRIETVGSDGFWIHEMGANAGSLGEVKILLDNQGKAYMEVSGAAVLLGESAFHSAFPDNVLIVKRTNVDQFRRLVLASPHDLDVQLVTALCRQHIPVMTFTDSGLTDADNVSLSEACALVGTESSLQMFSGSPTAAESLDAVKRCNEQSSGIHPFTADLAGDGNPFTISYGECETVVKDNGSFVTIRRNTTPTACIVGIPVTEQLYYMKVESTKSGASALHIKGTHRDTDDFDSLIQVTGGQFVVSNANGLLELHCE